MKKVSVTAVTTILLLLVSAVYGRASDEGMLRIVRWCLNETVNREELPAVCLELLTSTLLDEVKAISRILGLTDANGNVQAAVLQSAARCINTAFVQQFDSFDYPVVIQCVVNAAEAYGPNRAGE